MFFCKKFFRQYKSKSLNKTKKYHSVWGEEALEAPFRGSPKLLDSNARHNCYGNSFTKARTFQQLSNKLVLQSRSHNNGDIFKTWQFRSGSGKRLRNSSRRRCSRPCCCCSSGPRSILRYSDHLISKWKMTKCTSVLSCLVFMYINKYIWLFYIF